MKHYGSEHQIVTNLRNPIDRAISHFYFYAKLCKKSYAGLNPKVAEYKNKLNLYLDNYQLMLESRDIWQDGQALVAWLTGSHIGEWASCPKDEQIKLMREYYSLDVESVLTTAIINLRKIFWFGIIDSELYGVLEIEHAIKTVAAVFEIFLTRF